MDLSIIVISYNTCDLTLKCLKSIFQETEDINYEVIVFDNASADHSADMISQQFPQVRLIRSNENIGFARANNMAAGQTKGDYMLLLNPDTVILNHAINRLLAFAKTYPDGGIYGGRTIFPDGKLNPTFCFGRMTAWSMFCRAFGLSKVFKKKAIFDPESYGSWAYDSVKRVDIVTGCFFMVKRNLWEKLKGFNSLYFMFGEEVDFCLRAKKLGYRPLFNPDAEIIHYGGASSPFKEERLTKVLCADSTIIREHWPRYGKPWGLAMLVIGVRIKSIVFSLLAKLGSEKFVSQSIVWNKVWKRRSEWWKGWQVVRQP